MKGSTKINWVRLGYILAFISVLLLPAPALSASPQSEVPYGIHVLYVGKLTPQPDHIRRLDDRLAAVSLPSQTLLRGKCLAWNESIDGTNIGVFITDNMLWLHIVIESVTGVDDFLNDLLKTIARERSLPSPEDCRLTNIVTIPIIDSDGEVNIAAMQVPESPASGYYQFIPRQSVAEQYKISPENISMAIDGNDLYWRVQAGDESRQVKALAYHSPDKSQDLNLRNTPISSIPADFSLPPAIPDPTHTDYVIMYKSSLSGWDEVINALHSKHPDYQDLSFTNNISERLSDLQSIKPKYIIIVIDPTDGGPDFFDDADNTMYQIDDDEFQDSVWTVITGFDAAAALELVNAPNASNDHTLIIANPDGSLDTSGNTGDYLASIISDDDTLLGSSTHYVNTTSSNDDDATAQNLQNEVNNNNKDCVLFLGHGNTNGWGLRDDHSFRGNDSNLATWGSTYDINNNKNSLVYASSCLTSRIHGERDTAWEPWENTLFNETGTAASSIALAWMEDSPGIYIGAASVSYGAPLIKIVLLNMMKFGYTPAEALILGKNVYHHVIDDETLDTDPLDGDADDFLLFLERGVLTLGDPAWQINMAGNPPDYTISYTSRTQQDQEATTRGYAYVDDDIKWRCTTTLEFNEELYYEFLFSAYAESPLTLLFVEEVFAFPEWGLVVAYDACAVIAGIFKPTSDTTSIDFAGDNPSDSTYKLYDHPPVPLVTGTTDSYEIFKCKKNTDELIWIVGAGITDANSNDEIEWRINDGYSQSFDVYYWIPGVAQTVGAETVVDPDTRQKEVTLENKGTQTVQQVIASVPVPTGTTNLSVSPGTGITNITTTSDGGQEYCEFTVASFTAGETRILTIQYDVSPVVDLHIGGIWTVPDPPVGGQSAQIWFAIENVGGQGTQQTFDCEMFIYGGYVGTFEVNGLDAGESKQYFFTTTLDVDYRPITITADSAGVVDEGNEDNNERTQLINWIEPGAEVVWNFLWGPDVFPKYLPEDVSAVILADLTNLPDGIYGVYWADPVSQTWKAFLPGFPDWSDLVSLVPGEDYAVAVAGAIEWHIPLD